MNNDVAGESPWSSFRFCSDSSIASPAEEPRPGFCIKKNGICACLDVSAYLPCTLLKRGVRGILHDGILNLSGTQGLPIFNVLCCEKLATREEYCLLHLEIDASASIFGPAFFTCMTPGITRVSIAAWMSALKLPSKRVRDGGFTAAGCARNLRCEHMCWTS